MLARFFLHATWNMHATPGTLIIMITNAHKTTVFASGCFWCGEAVFQNLKGVQRVEPGYSGGETETANYDDVSTGRTEHREAFQVTYNPDEISYTELLDIFWSIHDPTQEDGQGSDIGPQYKAAIFYVDEEEKRLAETSKRQLEESGAFKKPIATDVLQLKNFFPAEHHHLNYYRNNTDSPYCQAVISPKIEKVQYLFEDKIQHTG